MNSRSPRELIDSCLVWDNHGCMPLRPDDDDFLPQLARYRASGVNVVSLNVGFGEQGIEDHVRMIAHLRHWVGLHGQDYMLARTTDDLERARAQGRLAILFDIEGMNAVEDQLSMVQLYHDLGVRWMLVAYNRHNRAGGGCQQENDPGLSDFGRRILDEMARVGMVACCSHSGHRTAMDVMSYSELPVIFSHSNAYSVHSHPRNVRDEALRACAATGGVVCVNGIGIFTSHDGDPVAALVRHIDHIASLIGIEHVGLGLDYVFDQNELDDLTEDAALFPPELGYGHGMRMIPPERLADIVLALQRIGYADRDIARLLGENLLRVAQIVWPGGRRGKIHN